MEKPDEIVKDCPRCGHLDTIELREESMTFQVGLTEQLSGIFWFYICRHCGDRFTTTKSDEISFSNLKKVS